MRQLEKSAAPDSLKENAERWTARYLESGQRTRPWAIDAIKQALASETAGKCAYCEAKMLAVSYGDIEHFRPKRIFPELVVEWANLTLACSRCNQAKGAKWDPALPFVNPYEDAIQEHLSFLGPLVFGVSDRGDYTLNELELNDSHRVEARDRTLREIEGLLRRYESSQGYTRDRLGELIDLQMQSGDFTAAVLTYVRTRKAAINLSGPQTANTM
ncbi:HNH endonuclease [Microbacterium galbinum]|uniref:HNH endonuclease n=1 Tax=Microbacterium galbinum TaxID=2851646 RepID=A0ABY4IS74_9MICO|nr:HNH endonuclease [Microbacterium galbinum]UPL14681.1 HNH endonuclease [Microbacterium galbinum]